MPPRRRESVIDTVTGPRCWRARSAESPSAGSARYRAPWVNSVPIAPGKGASKRSSEFEDPQARWRGRRPPPSCSWCIAIGIYVLTQVSRSLYGEVLTLFAQSNGLVARGDWYRIFTPVLVHAIRGAHPLQHVRALSAGTVCGVPGRCAFVCRFAGRGRRVGRRLRFLSGRARGHPGGSVRCHIRPVRPLDPFRLPASAIRRLAAACFPAWASPWP